MRLSYTVAGKGSRSWRYSVVGCVWWVHASFRGNSVYRWWIRAWARGDFSSKIYMLIFCFSAWTIKISFVCSQQILRRSLMKKLQNQRLDHCLALRASLCWDNSGKPSGYVFLLSCTTFCFLVYKKPTNMEQEHREEDLVSMSQDRQNKLRAHRGLLFSEAYNFEPHSGQKNL